MLSIWIAVESSATTVEVANYSVVITVSIYSTGLITHISLSREVYWIVVILIYPPTCNPVSKPTWTKIPAELTKVIWPSKRSPIYTPGTMLVDYEVDVPNTVVPTVIFYSDTFL